MPTQQEILLDGTGVSLQASDTFFPADIESSELDTSSSFQAAIPNRQNVANRVHAVRSEDLELSRIEAEIQRLQSINRYLHCSIHYVHNKAKHAKEEQVRLRKCFTALHKYKESVSFQKPDHACWNTSGTQCMQEEDPTETFMTFSSPAMVQGASPALERQSMNKQEKGAGMQKQKLPPKLEKNASTAHAAAVAAAALSVNDGQPAAALIDLLELANHRRQRSNEEAEKADLAH